MDVFEAVYLEFVPVTLFGGVGDFAAFFVGECVPFLFAEFADHVAFCEADHEVFPEGRVAHFVV